MFHLLFELVRLISIITLFSLGDSCQEDYTVDFTIISGISLLSNNSNSIRVVASDDTCYLLDVVNLVLKSISCDTNQNNIRSSSIRDEDPSNTIISSIEATNNSIKFNILRNDESLIIYYYLTPIIYNNYSLWYYNNYNEDIEYLYFTLNSINTTLIIIQFPFENDDYDDEELYIAFSIEFENIYNNNNYEINYLILTEDVFKYRSYGLELGNNIVKVYESILLSYFPIYEDECSDDGYWITFNYNKYNLTLNISRLSFTESIRVDLEYNRVYYYHYTSIVINDFNVQNGEISINSSRYTFDFDENVETTSGTNVTSVASVCVCIVMQSYVHVLLILLGMFV